MEVLHSWNGASYEKGLGGETNIKVEASIFVAIQRKGLKLTFDIGSMEGYDAPGSVLLAEFSPEGIGLGLLEGRSRTMYRYTYATGDNKEGSLLPGILKAFPEYEGPFSQVAISYRFPSCVLVPSTLYRFQEEGLFLQSAGADIPGQVLRSDHLPSHSLQAVYGLPKSLNIAVTRQYLRHQYWHQFAVFLKNAVPPSGSFLSVDIRPGDFAVSLYRDGQPELLSIFPYASPADVLYRLVHLSESFGLSRDTLPMEVSGFVDEGSSLFHEMRLYFAQITFPGKLETLRLAHAFEDHPAHYFSSLSKLAACVSYPEH
ncbi:MAG: hypothetical protein B7Z54_06040 [Sphingobacteriales bacterium 12-47-4]|nr:MAG: hypothetical protein B7Z54_06040 [Sphingobacteriales bacterium 12-47-4]